MAGFWSGLSSTLHGLELLAAELAEARDATGDMAEAIDLRGREGANELLLEWRGSLFRVRLARMRLTSREPTATSKPARFPAAAAAATALTFLGVGAFVAGAVLILWPLWAAGLGLVAGGYLAYRP